MGPIGCLLLIVSLVFTLGTSFLVMWFFLYNQPGLAMVIVLLLVIFSIVVTRKAIKDLKRGELRPEDYFDDDEGYQGR